MRILPVKERTDLKQKEQEREARIASTLAESIGKLHERKISDEESLAHWRESAFKAIQQDIDRRLREKVDIECDIADLEKKRAILLKPLDAAWEDVEKAEQACEAEQKRLAELATDLNLREHENGIMKAQLKAQFSSIEKKQEEIQKDYAESKKILDSAKKRLAEAVAQSSSLEGNAQAKMQQAEAFEENIRMRALEIKQREDSLNERESELESRELQIIAKELALQSPVRPFLAKV